MHTPSWIRDLFDALDDKDVEGFCSYLTDDVTFVYASEGSVQGFEEVRGFVADFVSGIESSDHTVHEVIQTPTRVVVRGEVHYVRLDGSDLTVPFANIFELEDAGISVYQVYVDQDLG